MQVINPMIWFRLMHDSSIKRGLATLQMFTISDLVAQQPDLLQPYHLTPPIQDRSYIRTVERWELLIYISFLEWLE